MTERRTTVMILVPGRNAISLVLPRSPRASVMFGLLLPLLSGVVAQRYASAAVGPAGPVALASLSRIADPVSTVSAALQGRSGQGNAGELGLAALGPSPLLAAASGPGPFATTAPSGPYATAPNMLSVLTSAMPTPEPSTPILPLMATDDAPQPKAAGVIDVKSMLRTLLGLRRGTASPDDVARIPRSGALRLEALHLNEAIDVHPFNDRLEPDPAAMAQVSHAMRCRVTGIEVPIDPELVEILVKLHVLYGRPIQLVSGHRQPNTIGTKETSQHTLGRAADIRIPGVGAEELKRVAMRLGARGVGLYPEKGFVHVDVRQKTRYSWVYTEARGEQPDWGAPVRPRRVNTDVMASAAARAEPDSESDNPEHDHELEPQPERRAD